MFQFKELQRQPSITIIGNASLSERIDAGYYHASHLEQLNKIISKPSKKLNQISEITKLSGFEFTEHFTKSGGLSKEVPCVMSQNVRDNKVNLSETIFITSKTHKELTRSQLNPGDIVLSYTGHYRRAAVIKHSDCPIHLGPNVCKLTPNNVDPYFVSTYLNSVHGQALLDREKTISAQPTVNMARIRELDIIDVEAFAQKYIGDKVRQAERLRAWAKTLDMNIAAYFAGLVANPLPPRVSWLAKKEDLDPYRINPKQYDPVVLDLMHRAKVNGIQLEPLSELTGARQIAGGATPKGAKYFDKGVLFARVQNVKSLRLDLSDAVYIDQSADEELARSRCATDDIILTITGYPGTASLVTEEDLPVNINQHSVRFNIRDDIEPGYVCAALNSKFLKYQVDRLAIGGTRDALDYPSVGRLLIPRYEAELEQKIGEQARSVIAAEKLSQRLTNVAKLFVEALIEGQLTEAELIAAEQALQADNDQPDRRILNRLKTDGIDGQGQPLLSDLDQLYSLLEQASHS
jgi:type I restriction enzyme S subunit